MPEKLTERERSELLACQISPVPLWGRGELNEPVLDRDTRSWLDRGLVKIVTEDGRVGFRLTELGRSALAKSRERSDG